MTPLDRVSADRAGRAADRAGRAARPRAGARVRRRRRRRRSPPSRRPGRAFASRRRAPPRRRSPPPSRADRGSAARRAARRPAALRRDGRRRAAPRARSADAGARAPAHRRQPGAARRALHAVAQTPQDDQRALQLLDNVAKSNPGLAAVKQLASVLQVQVAERQRAVRDEQQKADAAIQKLEALRADGTQPAARPRAQRRRRRWRRSAAAAAAAAADDGHITRSTTCIPATSCWSTTIPICSS